MMKNKKSPLELALQRSQIALHEAALEVGRLRDLEDRVRKTLTGWNWIGDDKLHISIPVSIELMSFLSSWK